MFDVLIETIRPVFVISVCVFIISVWMYAYCSLVSGRPTTLLLLFLVEEAIPHGVVGRSGAASCGVMGRAGALCVAAAVNVRDAPQFRHCRAVGATGCV